MAGEQNLCPFLNKPDVRCTVYLNLKNLNQAFVYCTDCYKTCPIFQQLAGDAHKNDTTNDERFLAAS